MSRPWRRPRKLPDRIPLGMGRCPDCGKYRYESRKAAKTEARRQFPGDQPSAYRCGEFWHWGHLPADVRDGTLDRAVWDGRGPARVETDL